MKYFIRMVIIILICVQTVSATEFTAPEAPSSAEKYLQQSDNFWDDFLHIVEIAMQDLQPNTMQSAKMCATIIAITMFVSILRTFPGAPPKVCELVAVIAIGTLLFQPTNTFIHLGTHTIQELSNYGRLLLPVMTASLAAQGGPSTSTALHVGTVLFDAILTSWISNVLVPLLYIYMCLCLANSAIMDATLKNLRDFSKWLITWSLKIILYVFTGYMSITNVINGSADSVAVKATKLTISGAVPVVGNILSDASETILVSAGVMKNAAGIYGLMVILALFIGPFLQIGVQYLFLKLTAGICSIFGTKNTTELIHSFSGAMGITLAMTGTACLLLLISTVCFMMGGA